MKMFNHSVLLVVILIFFTNCGADSNCCHKVSLEYLDAAADFIGKAKSNFPSQVYKESKKSENVLDCSELLEIGYKKNGVYKIRPKSRITDGKPLEVYCDMETDGGGWTIIQRRGLFDGPVEDFYKDWKTYKAGFGDIQKEFWIGNDNIFALTNQRIYSARFDLRNLDNESIYAHYDTFWIDSETSKYTLHIADYKGDASDFMAIHQSQKFSTKDEDNDNDTRQHCAESCSGAWWYKDCYHANLNGRRGEYKIYYPERGSIYLEAAEIKIRPRNFRLPDASLDNTPM